MTGDIVVKLANSEAASSLRMEAQIARHFRALGWPAEQSTYYTDLETRKLREIDVHSHRVFAEKSNEIETITNFHAVCECKSLNGYHVIFTKRDDSEDDYLFRPNITRQWIGNNVDQILERFCKKYRVSDSKMLIGLRNYLESRSHPDDLAIATHIEKLPEVDVCSTAFRETNSDRTREENSVVWNGILALLSAVRSIECRFRDTAISKIVDTESIFSFRSDDHLRNMHFNLNYELLSTVYIHPTLFLRANLWSLMEDNLRQINRARLYIRDVIGLTFYVDIVSVDDAEPYLAEMIGLFDRTIKESSRISRIRLNKCGWHRVNERSLKAAFPA